MADYTALFDACALYPFTLRDTLLWLATAGLFRARWTVRIDEEWVENLVKNGGNREKLSRTRDLMRRAVLDWEVKNYEHLIDTVELPDPGDRHVLAAAIAGRAEVIVTTNLRHFPVETLKKYDIEAQHPDDFVICQFDLNVEKVVASFKRQRANLRNPPLSVDEFLESLARSEMVQTIDRLNSWKELI